jgi:hypothetical protein
MCNNHLVRSYSEPSVNHLVEIFQSGHIWSTTRNQSGTGHTKNLAKESKKRSVRFQPQVKVILIPSRTEYTDANVPIDLWWRALDYISFKSSAVNELTALMLKKGICNSKEAIHILFQTGFDCEETLEESSEISAEEY